MLTPEYTTKFKRDLKVIEKRNLDMELIKDVIRKLCIEENLPERYKDHNLLGKWSSFRECHILPDWLLIYKIKNNTIVFERTGTHSDLFE